MMAVRKNTWTDKKTGCKREVSFYSIDFKDNRGIRRNFPAFPDKTTSLTLEAKLLHLRDRAALGIGLDAESKRFVDQLPQKHRDMLIEWRLIDRESALVAVPLMGLLQQYVQDLENRERSARYVQKVLTHCALILKECHFNYWPDIHLHDINKFLATLRVMGLKHKGVSYGTSNQYLSGFKSFCNWCDAAGLNGEPMRTMKRLDESRDRKLIRRAMTQDEQKRLLEATASDTQPFSCKKDRPGGPERALIYALAIATGMRAKELTMLEVRDFDFSVPGKARVTCRGQHAKSRRDHIWHFGDMPMTESMERQMPIWLAPKHPTARVFRIPPHTAEMIRRDMLAAGISWSPDQDGKSLDFHALRDTMVTNLYRAGIDEQTAMFWSRHSSHRVHQIYIQLHDEDVKLSMGKVEAIPLPDLKLGA